MTFTEYVYAHNQYIGKQNILKDFDREQKR